MTDTTDIALGDFEGHEVLTTTVKVTKAGDGLSKSVEVDAEVLHHGDRGAIILEYEVVNVDFPCIKDTDGVSRRHTLETKRATLVDLAFVREKLDEQQRRIDEASGQLTLEVDGDGEPEAVGDVLGDAIDLAQVAEHTQEWRKKRTKELHADASKDELRAMASGYDLTMSSRATVAELVEAIVDHEETNGDAEVPF